MYYFFILTRNSSHSWWKFAIDQRHLLKTDRFGGDLKYAAYNNELEIQYCEDVLIFVSIKWLPTQIMSYDNSDNCRHTHNIRNNPI